MLHFLGLLKIKEKSQRDRSLGTRWNVRKNVGQGKRDALLPTILPPGFLFRMITPFLPSFPAFTMRSIASEGRPQLVLPENPARALHVPTKLKSELSVPTGYCWSGCQDPLVWAEMQITSRCVRGQPINRA